MDAGAGLLDPATGREIATLVPPNAGLASWLCFSPDGAGLAMATLNAGIQFWDPRLIRSPW
jgi:hypothetical protein